MKLHRLLWFTTTSFTLPLALLSGVLFCVAPSAAQAQSMTFAGAQATIGSGLATFGLAVDSSGNVFVTDPPNGLVQEILAVNGSIPSNPTIKTLASGFDAPVGIAVDANDNVFVSGGSTSINGTVREILAVNGSIPQTPTIKTLASGFNSPFGLAVDAKGDVFVADSDHNAVKEILAVNGSIPANPTVNTLGSGFNMPLGVAVDAQGNVYVADAGNNEAKELLAVSGSIPSSPTIKILASGFSFPSGVAVDESGNVFVTDTSTDKLKEILAVDGSIPSNPTIKTLGSGIAEGGGVAVDGQGNVFVVDASDVVEVQTQDANFGSVSVCPSNQAPSASCSDTLTFNYNITAGGTLSAPRFLTQGTSNLDFTLAGNNTCTGSVTAGTTCTVNVTFAPRYPGERNGAVQILDNSGNVIAATTIHGIGTAPAVAFGPPPQLSLSGGPGVSFGEPSGAALDGSGDIFVADFGNHAVYKMLAGYADYSIVQTLGGVFAFGGPAGVAVDGSGNLFVADFSNKAIYEIAPTSAFGPYTIVTQLATSFTFGQPTDVALDGNGNLFVTDLNGAVYEVLAAGGYTTVNRLASSFAFSQPTGLSIDSSGDVFVTDVGRNGVYEILAAGNYTTVNQLASGFTFKSLLGVSVGASGNVFVADADFTNLFEILAPAYTTVLPLGSDLGSPWSVTVGQDGNLYVPDFGSAGMLPPSIQVIFRSKPPAFSFIPTNIGSTSIDSPKSLVFENVGNQPLVAIGYQLSNVDFTFADGTGSAPQCSRETLTLTPGEQCGIGISFTPQSLGPILATLTLADNSLNGNPATQTLDLSGTGISPTPVATFSPATLSFGDQLVSIASALQTATLTNTGGAPMAISAIKLTGADPSSFATSNNCPASLAPAGFCTIRLRFDPGVAGAAAAALTVVGNAGNSPQSIALSGTGVTAGLTLSATSVGFANQAVGTSSNVAEVTVTNTTAAAIGISSVWWDGPNQTSFAISDNCGSGLAPAHSCTIRMRFNPNAAGIARATVYITNSLTSSPLTIAMHGTGTL